MKTENSSMQISGIVRRIFYSSGRWASFVMETDQGEMMKASGNVPDVQEGIRLLVTGCTTNHPKYGPQFEIDSVDEIGMPASKEGVLQYLSSGYIRGLGKKTAKRVVDHFGASNVFDIIEMNPMRLTEVRGISEKKAQQIAESYAESCVYRTLLTQLKLTDNKARLLYDTYGTDAVKILKENPYRMIYDCDGIGFKIADQLALANGFDAHDPRRVRAAITYCLLKIGDEGHCWTHIDSLDELLKEIIPDIETEVTAACLAEAINSGEVVVEEPQPGVMIIYAKKVYEAEDAVAHKLIDMLSEPPAMQFSSREIDIAITSMEDAAGFDLADKQKLAISTALRNNVSVITGGAGTGKTTIIQAIIDAWLVKHPYGDAPEDCVVLLAPTGKAARRMSEVTGIHAETIQRRLYSKKSDAVADTPFLYIIDEASMLDIMLASSFIASLSPKKAQVVFVGDINQLPPIGAGNFLRDLIQSPFVPTVQLDISQRQRGRIAINADRINKGAQLSTLALDDQSFTFQHAERDVAPQAIIGTYLGLLRDGYRPQDICVVVPIRKSGRSRTSANDLNEQLRAIVNPADNLPPSYAEYPWRVGDRIMYTTNDYKLDIFNGDCGEVIEVDLEEDQITVALDDGRKALLNQLDQKNCILSYVMTVHKSQGSEFKAAIVALNKEHAYMLQRALLYTAVTRARERVILIGDPAAVNMAVAKVPALERNTSLVRRLMMYHK